MIIYRLEHAKSADGPFCNTKFFRSVSPFFTHKTHPGPERDGLWHDMKVMEDARFGCPSFNLLRYWMVCSTEKRLLVLKDSECTESLEETRKLVIENNRILLDGLNGNYAVARYHVPDQYCIMGKAGTQLVFDAAKVLLKTHHSVRALYRGALM